MMTRRDSSRKSRGIRGHHYSLDTRRDAIAAIGGMKREQRIETLGELESTLDDETLRNASRAYGSR